MTRARHRNGIPGGLLQDPRARAAIGAVPLAHADYDGLGELPRRPRYRPYLWGVLLRRCALRGSTRWGYPGGRHFEILLGIGHDFAVGRVIGSLDRDDAVTDI